MRLRQAFGKALKKFCGSGQSLANSACPVARIAFAGSRLSSGLPLLLSREEFIHGL